ncbi:glycosyltransferase family 4 protein [Aliamphritea hakodatensis]|uniref:glycosyltransferase family 4 protein n=1 Tax=Aliamphritea hakodatensis TaxID=2895352 RepID=UPI0022FD5403|nr:glycosyltransferase family 4 protein [Aliamphritea hakodatensis]
MKRIAHLNFAKGFRGGERQTMLLIETLAARGYTQQLFVRHDSELAQRCRSVPGLTIVALSKPYIAGWRALRDTDLLHAHETKGAQVACLMNCLFGVKYIVTRRVDNTIKDNFFTRMMYARASRSVALSSVIRDMILERSPDAQVDVIPSASTHFSPDPDQVAALRERFAGRYLIGNIGELDNTHKGQKYLIEAFKELPEDEPYSLILLGKGKDEEAYRQQAEGMDNIIFEGYVNNVGDYIACMDLFVFPSQNEGLGSVLLDVMEQKVPVIASDVGGIPDLVTHEKTGLLVPPGDSRGLNQAIQRLQGDATLSGLLAEQASQQLPLFSVTAMADSYEALYEDAIKVAGF